VPMDYWQDPAVGNMLSSVGTGPIAREDLPAAVEGFIDRHDVAAVVVDPVAGGFWEDVLDETELRKKRVGGIVLYLVP
jgi:hypothetical protein